MDVTVMAAAAASLLRPFLVGVAKHAGPALEEAGGKLADAAVDAAKRIWDRLLPAAATPEGTGVEVVAEAVGENPEDEGALAALQWHIERLLRADQALAADIAAILDEPGARVALGNIAEASGPGSIAVGGNVSGSTLKAGDQRP